MPESAQGSAYRHYLLGFSKVPMALEKLSVANLYAYLIGVEDVERPHPRPFYEVKTILVDALPLSERS